MEGERLCLSIWSVIFVQCRGFSSSVSRPLLLRGVRRACIDSTQVVFPKSFHCSWYGSTLSFSYLEVGLILLLLYCGPWFRNLFQRLKGKDLRRFIVYNIGLVVKTAANFTSLQYYIHFPPAAAIDTSKSKNTPQKKLLMLLKYQE